MTVVNVVPEILTLTASATAQLTFRIAGEKWHDVVFTLYEDGESVAEASITRYPGSPNDQAVTLEGVSIDLLSNILYFLDVSL